MGKMSLNIPFSFAFQDDVLMISFMDGGKNRLEARECLLERNIILQFPRFIH